VSITDCISNKLDTWMSFVGCVCVDVVTLMINAALLLEILICLSFEVLKVSKCMYNNVETPDCCHLKY